jgi:hypothetical protein
MPTVEQILLRLGEIANNWRLLAIFWHAYFAALAIALVLAVRPSKRLAGLLLALPLLSVSAAAWASANPFNGIIYAVIGILFIAFSARLPRQNVQLAPLWILIPGVILFLFGWVYPHFLETSSFLTYLYSAPIGLIPCATLSIVIGLFLILNGLGSQALSLILGLAGLFYGITGVFQLKVMIDWVLLLGAIMILIVVFARKRLQPG